MILSPKTVQRYRELKQQVSDCLLLMQVGAFMHVMDDDARAVAAVTGLKLQMAGNEDAHRFADASRMVRAFGTEVIP